MILFKIILLKFYSLRSFILVTWNVSFRYQLLFAFLWKFWNIIHALVNIFSDGRVLFPLSFCIFGSCVYTVFNIFPYQSIQLSTRIAIFPETQPKPAKLSCMKEIIFYWQVGPLHEGLLQPPAAAIRRNRSSVEPDGYAELDTFADNSVSVVYHRNALLLVKYSWPINLKNFIMVSMY